LLLLSLRKPKVVDERRCEDFERTFVFLGERRRKKSKQIGFSFLSFRQSHQSATAHSSTLTFLSSSMHAYFSIHRAEQAGSDAFVEFKGWILAAVQAQVPKKPPNTLKAYSYWTIL